VTGQYLQTAGSTALVAHTNDDPRKELRIGAAVAFAFFVIFLGWAAFAPLDAAAFANGQLQVSGQRQSVQHREGGIVSAIRVKEGQKVRAGEVLIELAGGEVRAQENAMASQMVNLLLQRARLEAEQQGASEVNWPTSFGYVNAPADQVAQSKIVQEGEFRARRSLLLAQQNVLTKQSQESAQSAGGYGAQMASSVEQERLITEELDALRTVADKGFVSKSRIRALERAKADLAGQGGQYRANVAEAHLAANANRLREIEADRTYRERATTELKEVSATLDALTPKYREARDQLERLQIRAPVSGTVVGLSIFTVGGVIGAGQRLLDIVPEKAELVVAVRLSPNDIDDIAVGDQAELRFSGMHDRNLPIMMGKITRISADAMNDQKSGASFYTAELKVGPSEMQKLRDVRGPNFVLPAGAPVEAIIPVRKRTALQYAFEPLFSTLRKSGGEH
jgi:HlyD family secretion protein